MKPDVTNLNHEILVKDVVDRATDFSLWCYAWQRGAAFEAFQRKYEPGQNILEFATFNDAEATQQPTSKEIR